MSTISSGTTLTTALVQIGDTTGDLVIKTGASNTTAMTISGANQGVTFANAVTYNGTVVFSGGLTGNAAGLTSLNGSNVTSGTIATARLATGTANSTTYLRGDQTWATVTQTRISGGTTGLTPNTLTGGDVTLAGTLAVANGGTGTASPSLVGGTNITISGSWPNQTVTAASGAPTTAQVLSATAGASLGDVGVYSWLWTTTTGAVTAGTTIAGSNLRYAGFQTGASGDSNNSDNSLSGNGGTPSGTWRVMGRGAQTNYSVFLGLRIS